jgi:hypothetical protein
MCDTVTSLDPQMTAEDSYFISTPAVCSAVYVLRDSKRPAGSSAAALACGCRHGGLSYSCFVYVREICRLLLFGLFQIPTMKRFYFGLRASFADTPIARLRQANHSYTRIVFDNQIRDRDLLTLLMTSC